MKPGPLVRAQYTLASGCVLQLAHGDITSYQGDALVNAANPTLLGGGGVDAAIHAAAGPRLLEACKALPELRRNLRCPTGQAKLTPAGDLDVEWVIHTVGPIYDRVEDPDALLTEAYASCLRIAREQGIQRIAFPAISCGVYGFPLEEAAEIALSQCEAGSQGLTEICFVLFSSSPWTAFSEEARRRWG